MKYLFGFLLLLIVCCVGPATQKNTEIIQGGYGNVHCLGIMMEFVIIHFIVIHYYQLIPEPWSRLLW
ncbi:MAG TPA: hypothetical protein DEQ30_03625 [Porphyromonadaceae bacterium]|nr:hypothetical protein [Porphyromonadaceae bacterium]